MVFAGVGVAINTMIGIYAQGISWVLSQAARLPGAGRLKGWADGVKAVGENSRKAADQGVKYMSEKWDELNAIWAKAEPVRGRVTADLKDQAQATKEAASQVEQLMKAQQTQDQKRAEALETMYKEAGLNAEDYYRNEVNKLTQRAKEWRDAGVDVEAINKWMFGRVEQLQEEAFGKGEEIVAEWMDHMKWHVDSMVTDLSAKQSEMERMLAGLGQNIAGLDKSEIGITVRLYDDAFVSGVNGLISKLQQLRNLQGSVAASGSGAPSQRSLKRPPAIVP